ncbi:NAD(P)-dependent alcohol dehydrogenase [Lewinella sp. IMCC34191]|uniref:NAD(P)-dependent alcohol dehydrogenase n=1 Tax=Lewinella sp. IMCC34191 TaxID=2259172 RepID=UPI0018E513F7|nr:NAD(P)-dependent alcohol dehydrogenase [Lewinella sp. IMCC34191]
MSTSMRAAIRTDYGPPERIAVTTVPKPVPGDHDLLVRVRATTVNRTDCANLTGRPLVMHLVLGVRHPREVRIGTDFAGEVVAVGSAVTAYRIGDRVCGFRDTGLGGQAEYITIRQDGPLMTIPPGLDFATAVASLEGGHYAYSFFRRSGVESGDRVLVNGGSGAIGSALLQFAVACGARVTSTTAPEYLEAVAALGASRVMDYTSEDFTRSPAQYDYVFDAVGKSTFGRCRPILEERGIYISSEAGPYLQNVFYTLGTALIRSGKRVLFPVPLSPKESLPFIRRQLEAGTFRPLLDDSRYTLDNIAEAYRYVMSGRKRGNVIVDVA